MMISGIAGMNPAGGIQGGRSDVNTQSIDQKIRQLENEIKKLKENDKLPPAEKEKKIKNIEEQIKKLEEQKEKMKKKESEDENPVEDPLDKMTGNNVDTTA